MGCIKFFIVRFIWFWYSFLREFLILSLVVNEGSIFGLGIIIFIKDDYGKEIKVRGYMRIV